MYLRTRRSSTGWRRLIGSPKLQIIFSRSVTKYRSLVRKMTYKDKGSYKSSPPCSNETKADTAGKRATLATENVYAYII